MDLKPHKNLVLIGQTASSAWRHSQTRTQTPQNHKKTTDKNKSILASLLNNVKVRKSTFPYPIKGNET